MQAHQRTLSDNKGCRRNGFAGRKPEKARVHKAGSVASLSKQPRGENRQTDLTVTAGQTMYLERLSKLFQVHFTLRWVQKDYAGLFLLNSYPYLDVWVQIPNQSKWHMCLWVRNVAAGVHLIILHNIHPPLSIYNLKEVSICPRWKNKRTFISEPVRLETVSGLHSSKQKKVNKCWKWLLRSQ